MTRLSITLCLAALLCTSTARAEESPEQFAFQLGVGMAHPDPGSAAFDLVYGGDNGPLLNLEFDFFVYRIPFVGPIGLGVSAGWAKYTAKACDASQSSATSCTRTNDNAKLSIFPVAIMALLRVDVLARKTPVPLSFVGKIGFDTLFFKEKVAGSVQGQGASYGLRWGAQLNLELNFIAPKRANALDHDWGINSSYLFFELIGSGADSKIPLSDKLAWTAGLGLTF